METVEISNPVCGLLVDELEARGLTQSAAAKAMGVDKQLLNAVVNARRDLSAEMAMRVECYLGIDAEFLLKIQTCYKLKRARQLKGEQVQREVAEYCA